MITRSILLNRSHSTFRTAYRWHPLRKIAIGITAFIILAALPSCSLLKKTKKPSQRPIIRYMNLKAVYNYMVNRNKEYSAIKKNIEAVISQMQTLDKALTDPRTDHIKLLKEYNKKKKQLSLLSKKGKHSKGKILSAINRAAKNYVKRVKVDFVFNISDELIYAKKDYDITEDIIREILKLKERSDPVSR